MCLYTQTFQKIKWIIFQNIFLMVFYHKKKSVSFLMIPYLVVEKRGFYLQRTTYVEKEYSNQACRC